MLGEEALSRPFRFELELASDDEAIDFDDLLGTAMAVEVPLAGGGKRWFHGLVSRFAFVGYEGDEARYRATLRPWLWFLCRTSDCRIFQEKSVPEIVRAIFDKHAGSSVRRRGAAERQLCAPRPYCVQYRESDLDFVDRLLQDEGITYFFATRPTSTRWCWPTRRSRTETCAAIRGGSLLPQGSSSRGASATTSSSGTWPPRCARAASRTRASTSRSRAPTSWPGSEQPLPQQPGPKASSTTIRGRYTEPDDRRAGGDACGSRPIRPSQRCAAGEGTAAGLAAGHRFTLARYPREDQNAEYLLREVEPRAVGPGLPQRHGGRRGVELYRCRFIAMPADIPYRPPLTTPRPLIRGPQTAMVTGPAGEEIWTDEYGRVKVQFHWDREGKRDEKSSCWVRVSQPWAGAGFGGIQIPRIGQEVIVEFLEGDPDRPIITGRVYNAQAMPPYASAGQRQPVRPQEQLVQGRRRLERAALRGQEGPGAGLPARPAGHEAVVENDRTEHVKNNHTGTVEVDETLTVHGKRTRTVDKEETVTVGGKRTRTVTGDETYTTKGDRTYTVGGKDVLHVTKAQEVTIGDARSLTITDEDQVKVPGNAKLEAAANREVIAGELYKLDAKVIEITGTIRSP